ncbi:hypothetical protein LPJ61_000992 [Coemansia biformis]|uniref:Large ribosomal subunit protein mL45 n=1 Tax=Coemansia biformis TaxID=1286918 RepID=A0A9W8CXP8_9FUNG|nr:hypothetical protein LPJ61_000992 [Coemansia biformis]
MTPIGLRACARGQPLLHSVAAALAAGRWRATRQGLPRPIPSAALVAVRHYARPPSQRYFLDDYGLLGDYIPAPLSASPSIFSMEGLRATKARIGNGITALVSLAIMKFLLWGWKKDVFAGQAEELYSTMNGAFGRGESRVLETICGQKMYDTMANEIKSRKVDFSWEKVRSVSPPRIVQLRCGQVTSSVYVGQVTVRIDQEQRVTSRPRGGAGARSGAKPGEPRTVHVREYIVFQREVSDKSAPWTIYGKLAVPSWDQPKN